MIEYKVDGKTFILSYQELKESYLNYVDMTDEDFLKNIKEVLHLACVICWLKEIPTYNCLRDDGIIHQLVHLLHIPDEPVIDLTEIRELFKQQLKLS